LLTLLLDEIFNETLTTIPEISPLRNEIRGMQFDSLARGEPVGRYDALAIVIFNLAMIPQIFEGYNKTEPNSRNNGGTRAVGWYDALVI